MQRRLARLRGFFGWKRKYKSAIRAVLRYTFVKPPCTLNRDSNLDQQLISRVFLSASGGPKKKKKTKNQKREIISSKHLTIQ